VNFYNSFIRDYIQYTLNLPNQFSRICHDQNLNLVNAGIDFHQARDTKSSSLATTIDSLKQEVFVGFTHDKWQGDGLDNRWFEVRHLFEACLKFRWNFKRFPSLLLAVQVNNEVFTLDTLHTVVSVCFLKFRLLRLRFALTLSLDRTAFRVLHILSRFNHYHVI